MLWIERPLQLPVREKTETPQRGGDEPSEETKMFLVEVAVSQCMQMVECLTEEGYVALRCVALRRRWARS